LSAFKRYGQSKSQKTRQCQNSAQQIERNGPTLTQSQKVNIKTRLKSEVPEGDTRDDKQTTIATLFAKAESKKEVRRSVAPLILAWSENKKQSEV